MRIRFNQNVNESSLKIFNNFPSSYNNTIFSSTLDGDMVLDLYSPTSPSVMPVFDVNGRTVVSSETVYKVKKGDTFSEIIRNLNLDEEAIINYNNLTKPVDNLSIGQEIKIPLLNYKIKSGDNLSNIASDFGVEMSVLMDLNNIENPDNISAGKSIKIPGYFYSVKQGDNLTKISEKTGLTIQQIMDLNSLSSDSLSIGQNLLIIAGKGNRAEGVVADVITPQTSFNSAAAAGSTSDTTPVTQTENTDEVSSKQNPPVTNQTLY